MQVPLPEECADYAAHYAYGAQWNMPMYDSSCGALYEPYMYEMPSCMGEYASSWMEQPMQAMVLVRGLPSALCNSDMMEAVLEQAGLDEEFVSCRLRTKQHEGEQRDMLLTLTSAYAAERCIQHFHGRCWGCSSLPVVACFAKSSDHEEPKYSQCSLSEPEDKTVQKVLEALQGSPVSEEDGQKDGAEAMPLGVGQTVVMPPPGLEINLTAVPAELIPAPPGLTSSRMSKFTKRLATSEEDSTDAGTSEAEDDPAEDEQLAMCS